MTPDTNTQAGREALDLCPFCGQKDAIIGCNDHEEPIWYIQCGCTAGICDQSSEEKAIAAWNTRPRSPTKAEPVAWRARFRSEWAVNSWGYIDGPDRPPFAPWDGERGHDIEPLYAAPQAEPVAGELEPYDTGLLGNYGGGNVEWWQDYIRSELATAHEFYQAQVMANRQDEPAALQAQAPAQVVGEDDWTPGPFSGVYDRHDKRVLLLASYCDDDNPKCTEERPCADCLSMNNVALVRGKIKVLGGLDYLAALSATEGGEP